MDIANELKDRMNTKPKTKAEIREELSDAEKQIMESMQDVEGAERALKAAMGMQDVPETADMAARIIRIASENCTTLALKTQSSLPAQSFSRCSKNSREQSWH